MADWVVTNVSQLNTALAGAVAGDNILVRGVEGGGSGYYETTHGTGDVRVQGGFHFGHSGTLGNPITLKPYPGDTIPTLANRPSGNTTARSFPTITFGGQDYCRVEGLKVDGAIFMFEEGSLTGTTMTGGGRGNAIVSNEIWEGWETTGDGNWSGVRVEWQRDYVVEDNCIHDIDALGNNANRSSQCGIKVFSGIDGRIWLNTINGVNGTDSQCAGIDVKADAIRVSVKFNWIEDVSTGLRIQNQRSSGSAAPATGCVFAQNIVILKGANGRTFTQEEGPIDDYEVSNNTFVLAEGSIVPGSDDGMLYAANSGSGQDGATWINNICYAPTAYRSMSSFASSFGSGGNCDYNHYDDASRPIRYGASNYANLAAFVAGTPYEDHATSGDPLFVNAGAGDYHLDVGSPCIGTGLGGIDKGAYITGDERIGSTICGAEGEDPGSEGSASSGSGSGSSGSAGSGSSGSAGSGSSGSAASGSSGSTGSEGCIGVDPLPFSRLVTQAEFNVANEIWFCVDVDEPCVLGYRTNAGGTFVPRTTVYEADRTTVVQGAVNGTFGIWATLPTAGSYAVQVVRQGGGTSDFDFTTSFALASLDDVDVEFGDLIINDDLDRPGTVFSPDGTLKGFVSDLPGGEMGAILPNGVSIWHDRFGHHDPANLIAVLDAQLNYIGSVACGLIGINFPIFAADATQFYVMNQAGELWTVSDAGVAANTGYVFPLEHELPVAMAVDPDGTVLYWVADDEDGVIRTVDLDTLLDGADFYTIPDFAAHSDKLARTANNHPGELFRLDDGTLVTYWYDNSELTYHLIHLSAAGALLHDITYVDPIQIDHIAQVYGQSAYVLIWLYTTIGFDTGRFGRLTFSTGAITADFTHALFEDGVNMLDATKFGMSTSCAFVVMQLAAVGGSSSSASSEGSEGSEGSSGSEGSEPAPEDCVLEQPSTNCWSGTVNPARNPAELIDS